MKETKEGRRQGGKGRAGERVEGGAGRGRKEKREGLHLKMHHIRLIIDRFKRIKTKVKHDFVCLKI